MRFLAIRRRVHRRFGRYTIPEWVLLLAPVAVWFSYYPTIQLGRQSGTNLELSVAIIYAVVLALVGLPGVWRARRRLVKSRAAWLLAAYVGWQVMSIIWSVNPLRSVLVSGLWAVLLLDFLVIYDLLSRRRALVPVLIKIGVGTAVVMSLIAISQVAYGAWSDWGLCRGCVASGFGFVRPSVFAIEPQFFGSLLLAPMLYLSSVILTKPAGRREIAALCVMTMALYVTLSRGAIYAFMLALTCQIIVVVWRQRRVAWRGVGCVVGIIVAGCGAGLLWHAVFAELNPRLTETAPRAIIKSINHLSLGVVKITLENTQNTTPAAPQAPSVTQQTETNHPAAHDTQAPQKAAFDGYVERSTTERTNLSQLAWEVWRSSPIHMLIGVGVGGAGRALHQQLGKTSHEFEIIQHEYLSVMVEQGMVGMALFGALIIGLAYTTRRHMVAAWGMILAFLIQWNFFSGLPNALHIYLVGMLMFAIISRVDEKTERIN